MCGFFPRSDFERGAPASCNGAAMEKSRSAVPPAELLIDYWLKQMLIPLKNTRKDGWDEGCWIWEWLSSPFIIAVSPPPPGEKVKEQRRGGGRVGWEMEGGDEGRWAGKQDWVRLIAACRGQTLSSANIIIRCSIRLQLSDIQGRQCVSPEPGATLCFLQFHLAARPTRRHRSLAASKQITGPSDVGGRASRGVGAGPGAWICPVAWLITSRFPPPVCCCDTRSVALWGI